MDGLALCRRLRAAGNSVPVLMVSARGAPEHRIDGLDAGADDYLPKPLVLLDLFMRNPGIVLSHGVVYDRVWGYDFGPGANSLRVYVGYLRRKLQMAGARPLIQAVRGVGYVLREP